jgi:hypothetical protein
MLGDGFKFADYYSSYGLKDNPIDVTTTTWPTIQSIIDDYCIEPSVVEKKKDEIYDVINEQKLSGDFYLAILGFITSTMNRILPLYKSQRDVKTPDEVSIAHAAGGMTNLLFNLLQTGDKYTLEEKQFFVYHLIFEQPNSFFELQDSKGY